MAKNTKTTAIAPVKAETAITSLMNIQTQLNFSNQDLVNIVSDRIMEKLRAALKAIQKEKATLVKALDEKKAKLVELNIKEAEAALAERKMTLTAFIKVWLAERTESMAKTLDSIHVSYSGVDMRGRRVATISCDMLSSLSVTLPGNDEIASLEKEIADRQKAISDLQVKENKVNIKIANIPEMERKAMNNLTRMTMAQSAKGAEYMAQIDSIVATLGLELDTED